MSDMATRDASHTVADDEAVVADTPEAARWELIRRQIVMTTNPAENHEQMVGAIFARGS